MSNLLESCDIFNRDVDERKLVVLVCRCSIEYWGRSRSIIGLGDRLITVKPDTTIIIHSLSGFKPVNWMSAPTDTIMEIDGSDRIVIHSQRTKKPYEEMKINVDSIIDYRAYLGLKDKSELELTHTEKDMKDYLVQNPRVIDPDLKIKSTEYRSPLGFFDIYGKIGETYAVVELKAERAGLPAALQVRRYVEWLESQLKQEVKGILIAPSITPNALSLLRKGKIDYRRFDIKSIQRRKCKHTLDRWVN